MNKTMNYEEKEYFYVTRAEAFAAAREALEQMVHGYLDSLQTCGEDFADVCSEGWWVSEGNLNPPFGRDYFYHATEYGDNTHHLPRFFWDED